VHYFVVSFCMISTCWLSIAPYFLDANAYRSIRVNINLIPFQHDRRERSITTPSGDIGGRVSTTDSCAVCVTMSCLAQHTIGRSVFIVEPVSILCNCQTTGLLAVFLNLVRKSRYNGQVLFSALLKRDLCTDLSNVTAISPHDLYRILNQTSCSLYLTFGLLANLANNFACRLYFVNKPNTGSSPSIDDIASFFLVVVFLETSLAFFQACSCNKFLMDRTDDGTSVVKRSPERTVSYPVVKGRLERGYASVYSLEDFLLSNLRIV
jgi:hypothetical protein